MLTYRKSAMRVRRMPMHLSSGHVTLMPGKFYLLSIIFLQSDVGAGQTHVGLCPKFLLSLSENDSFRKKNLCFNRDDLFIFFAREISEMPGPTGIKFCTMVSTRLIFITPVQNFVKHISKKISEAKNMQKLARFQTIFADRREILHDI